VGSGEWGVGSGEQRRKISDMSHKLFPTAYCKSAYNCCRFNLPKTHWLDAAYVGEVQSIYVENYQPLLIVAKGHGTRQICRTNK
jgi:hypothetical protein